MELSKKLPPLVEMAKKLPSLAQMAKKVASLVEMAKKLPPLVEMANKVVSLGGNGKKKKNNKKTPSPLKGYKITTHQKKTNNTTKTNKILFIVETMENRIQNKVVHTK